MCIFFVLLFFNVYYVVLSQFPLAGYVFVVVGGKGGGGEEGRWFQDILQNYAD